MRSNTERAWRPGWSLTALLVVGMTACEAPQTDTAATGADTAGMAAETAGSGVIIASGGLDTPESVVHDEAADVYLVSNIAGGPSDKDNNAFISRVSPAGEVVEARWIAAGQNGVTLHAPKGLALKGDTLFVADIDSIRAFDRTSGAPLGGIGVPGAQFLNDLAVGPDGALYATDSGFVFAADGAQQMTGTDAVFRISGSNVETVASGAALRNPNGVLVDDQGVLVVPFGGNQLMRIDGAEPTTIATLPGGQLDGLVQLDDGSLLASGWEGSAIYRIDPSGSVSTAIENVVSPADIGLDRTRQRVLIPIFTLNELQIRPIP